MSTLKLHNYQRKAVDFIKEKEKCALFLSMGLGKTLISLMAIKELLKGNKILTVLIIAPLRVCNHVWVNEIKKWEEFSDLTFNLCTGKDKKKINKLAQINIVTKDSLGYLQRAGKTKFGMIVLDESSSVKNSASVRFNVLKKFTYKYMVLLSGTPSPQGYLDLWSQYYLLDEGERLETTKTKYKELYFMEGFYKFAKPICIYPDYIEKKIKDITISMSAKDYLELPNVIYLTEKVSFDNSNHKKLMTDYNEYKKDMVLKVGQVVLTAFNAGVLCSKLLQYCNGAVYGENKEVVEVHDHKLKKLSTILEEHSNENILVAYYYKSDLERLKKWFPHGVELTNDNGAYERWNKGDIKLMFAQPSSCGKGLNLQYGGNIIIWFSLTWNLEDYLQFNARLARQGQIKPVIINHIIIENTIEEKVLECLRTKNQTQKNLLESLKI